MAPYKCILLLLLYKASLNKAFNKYQKDMQNKIRNLKSTDPKVYWQIINKSADDHTRHEVKKYQCSYLLNI